MEEIKTKICPKCGEEFLIKYNKLSRPQIYCSRECVHKSQNKKIQKTCDYCNKTFFVSPANINYHFCSLECYHKSMKTIKNKTCPMCKKEFVTDRESKTFCSLKCRTDNNLLLKVIKIRKRIETKNEKKKINNTVGERCYTCNKKILKKRVWGEYKKYCSKECYYESMKERLKVICPVCSTVFINTSKNQEPQRFCSRECQKRYFTNYSNNYQKDMKKSRKELDLRYIKADIAKQYGLSTKEVSDEMVLLKKISLLSHREFRTFYSKLDNKCAYCGKTFQRYNSTQKYCSKSCSGKDHWEQWRLVKYNQIKQEVTQ